MDLKTIPYIDYETALPQEGNFILGQRKEDNIIVYQAYNDAIADYAVSNQKFGGSAYSFSRMTWIKPNFLWMMCRSGWAEKENQQRILAIEMTFESFEFLLTEGVSTSHDPFYGDHTSWRKRLDNSDVRIQWDPDHDPAGGKLKRRAVQIGIKSGALTSFNDQFIQSINDITGFVTEQKYKFDNKQSFLVIAETIIDVSEALKEKFAIG